MRNGLKTLLAALVLMVMSGSVWAASVVTSVTPNVLDTDGVAGPVTNLLVIRGDGTDLTTLGVDHLVIDSGGTPVTIPLGSLTITAKRIAASSYGAHAPGSFSIEGQTAGSVLIPAVVGTVTIANKNLIVTVNATIASVVTIRWGVGVDSAGVNHGAVPGTFRTTPFIWNVGAVDTNPPAALQPSAPYDIDADLTTAPTIENASGAGTDVKILVSCSATTTVSAPATSTWSLNGAPGLDLFAMKASISGAANYQVVTTTPTLLGTPATVITGAAPTTAALSLQFLAPSSASGPSSDGNQASTVTLTALKN